jgi:hypothetical protein
MSEGRASHRRVARETLCTDGSAPSIGLTARQRHFPAVLGSSRESDVGTGDKVLSGTANL